MPEISVTPNPAAPSSWITVNGIGFSRSATKILVDGLTVGLDSFKPNTSGNFSIGFQARSTDGTQKVEAQQKKSGKWTTIAPAIDLVVKSIVVIPPQPTVPGVPLNLVAVAGDTIATLSWAAPTNNGGSPITGYSITGTPGPVTKTSTTTNINWTGLVNGTTYTFTVSAVNAVGTGMGVTTTVVPVGVIVPPPTGTYTKSGPITVTTSSTVIEWKEISSTLDDGAGLTIKGTDATHRVSNVTIRNCKITGFHSNFLLEFADNVTLEDCWIPQGFYCGFNIFSSNNVKVIRPKVDVISHTLPNAQGNNAYGVKIDTLNSGDPVCDTVEVSDGVFKESKLWMNMNAHSGKHISFLRNESHNAPRAIFVTGVEDLKIIGNKLLDPATTPGGTTDVSAITYGGVTGATIDQNQIDSRYPTKIQNISNQYGVGSSTGVVIGTNPVV